MDIPNYPGQKKDVAFDVRNPLQRPAPISLEQLNLIPGKTIKAVVTDSAPSTGDHSANQAAQAKSNPLPTEWILNINGKSLLVSTNVPLEIGQVLSLKLGSEHELLIQTTPSAGTLIKTSGPANNKLNSGAIATLLRAINQVLPRQVSLEHGFSELSQAAINNSMNPANQQAKSILEMLLKYLPKIPPPVAQTGEKTKPGSLTQSLFNPVITTSPPTDHSAKHSVEPMPSIHSDILVSALKNSGVFFEHAINQGLIKPNSLASEISLLQNVLMHSGQKNELTRHFAPNTDKTTPAAGFSIATATNKTDKQESVTTATSLGARLKSALNTQTLTSNINRARINQNQINQHTIPDNNTQYQTTQSKEGLDLKGALYKATAALTGLNPNNLTPSSRPGTYIDALTQVELLKTPFNFPHLVFDPSQNSIQKASAILSEQQLSTGQLLKLIAGMLNRIQFNQLNSIYQSHSNSNESITVQSWFLELPVIAPTQGINTFNIRIDQEEDKQSPEEQSREKKQPVWRIALSFDLESLGSIYVQANLFKKSISSTIWADKAETLALINRETPYLRQRLIQTGLEVGDICCQRGLPIQNRTKLEQSLVDIKA